MDWPQYILSLIGALGGGLTIREIIGAISRSRSGKTQAERVENKSLVARTRYAEDMAEYERSYRRQIEDHAANARRIARERGATIEELGPWPLPPEPPPRPKDDPETSTI
ncbi:hypothetical protein [Arthrobacter sp. JCM 19049]|uniref:hypothetical protein n=1 Tax=Arthrobacter sp. JCM 19049 TaxID=1460643 RepID=UPI0006D13064|nr:hypothetical protein [Arthrobacter sp. JCM 19049]